MKLSTALAILCNAIVGVDARAFDKSNITLSAVVAAPAGWPMPVANKDWSEGYFNLNETVAYGVELIHQASTRGADLIAFPELWFPGYPKSYEKKWTLPTVEMYVAESMQVDSPPWQKLLRAARDAEIYVSFGYSERSGDFIYMGQALLGPEGEVLINRRKLRPSASERGFWSDGTYDGLQVVDTKIGRVSMLECWEHVRPSAMYPISAQLPNIHIGAWPLNENPGTEVGQPFEDVEVAIAANRYLSVTTGAVAVMPSIGYGFINDYTSVLAESDSRKTASASGKDKNEPLIYASINGSFWTGSSYDVDGEFSWAVIEQIQDNYPNYIPKDEGDLVPWRKYNTSVIIANIESGKAGLELPPAINSTTGSEPGAAATTGTDTPDVITESLAKLTTLPSVRLAVVTAFIWAYAMMV